MHCFSKVPKLEASVSFNSESLLPISNHRDTSRTLPRLVLGDQGVKSKQSRMLTVDAGLFVSLLFGHLGCLASH